MLVRECSGYSRRISRSTGAEGRDDHRSASDQYLTGALYPERIEENPEEDEDKDGAEEAEGSPGDAISMQSMRRPNSMGVSFAMDAESPVLVVSGSAGSYQRRWLVDGTCRPIGEHPPGNAGHASRSPCCKTSPSRKAFVAPSVEGLQWWVRGVRDRQRWQVTLILTNTLRPDPGRAESEAATFFPGAVRAKAAEGGRIVPANPVGRDRRRLRDKTISSTAVSRMGRLVTRAARAGFSAHSRAP